MAGNKCDLEDERKVSKMEAKMLALSWKISLYETSALAHINVEEIFYQLVREIRKSQNVNTEPIVRKRSKSCIML